MFEWDFDTPSQFVSGLRAGINLDVGGRRIVIGIGGGAGETPPRPPPVNGPPGGTVGGVPVWAIVLCVGVVVAAVVLK